MPGARTGIVLLLAITMAGCGGGGDNPPGLTGGEAQALIAQLEAVRATAATRDVGGTKSALAKFRRSVARLQRDGALSAEAARALRLGAERVLKRVTDDSAPPPQPTVTQTAPAPLPPGQQKKKEEKHGKGHGKKGKED